MNRRQNFKDCYMTWTILAVLFLVFLLETGLGGSKNTTVLIELGAMNKKVILEAGQWWRLFTAQFLHIGIMHLISNVVMIYYLGTYLEQILGHWRFLLIYLLAGVGGNLLSLAFGDVNLLGLALGDNNVIVSAGASTALFGLMGAMTAIGLRNHDNAAIVYLGKQAFWLALLNLGFDLFDPNIDLWGHLGGLLTGLLLAIIVGDRRFRQYPFKVRLVAVCILIIYIVATVHRGLSMALGGGFA
ncbi:rhomboid family intramembrane serine protease [Lactobacillus sp. ESL0684]|uniref:rhomboid family intramembrane serine protease n=1 Tax=Lactobacillus sp. ESL0684 TaxID=2983213 RepID=UPI0023F82C6C|nr:rhomboid family intramembrane serine protease [Lactobacillus sp. ESL0684]WEV44256.1 rhomboid family intramembrane serine protease [Lactobacillus sp. ESL0684]